MEQSRVNFLRYPGGKQRLINQLIHNLPSLTHINGNFVEPFVGGGAIFFALNPKSAVLADINTELIDLYRGIRRDPAEVWETFRTYPATKRAYYKIRDTENQSRKMAARAARTLYLNRTCFKGMWRHNANGQFNVGYGGQDRRWVVNEEILVAASRRLKRATLLNCDFEEVIDNCSKNDFLFLDPPYRPGGREMTHAHYVHSQFSFDDHIRLAEALERSSRKGVRWAMTTSSHPDILRLLRGNKIIRLAKGTGNRPGIMAEISGEVLVCNFRRGSNEAVL